MKLEKEFEKVLKEYLADKQINLLTDDVDISISCPDLNNINDENIEDETDLQYIINGDIIQTFITAKDLINHNITIDDVSEASKKAIQNIMIESISKSPKVVEEEYQYKLVNNIPMLHDYIGRHNINIECAIQNKNQPLNINYNIIQNNNDVSSNILSKVQFQDYCSNQDINSGSNPLEIISILIDYLEKYKDESEIVQSNKKLIKHIDGSINNLYESVNHLLWMYYEINNNEREI